jgi:flagellar motor protein MotB
MEKLGAKLETFNQKVKDTIETLLETKGVQSRFTNSRLVIMIHDDEAMFNLGSNGWLVEISEDGLFDNSGYEYSFDSLKLEDLCIAIDSVIDGITPNFRVGTHGKNGYIVYEYFEDKEKAYEKFVKIQCTGEMVLLEERESELDLDGMPQYEIINEYLGEGVEE